MPEAEQHLTSVQRTWWRAAQIVVWCIGFAILSLLIFQPPIGVHAFWNVLIPVAPALFVFAPGLWRNICPLASTTLLSRHLNPAPRRRLTLEWQGRLAAISVVLLLAIVPLRHVILDLSGRATALALCAIALGAVFLGFFFEWKSGWCSGACPVHSVEKLYGQQSLGTVPNAHCQSCEKCTAVCPDSSPGMQPLLDTSTRWHEWAGMAMVGGFVGFIWGWFHVPNFISNLLVSDSLPQVMNAYIVPLAAMLVTLCVFVLIRGMIPAERRQLLTRLFAAAAVSCYYWYRIPALFGFGLYPGDGMLIDLHAVLPIWFPVASRVVTTSLFMWWLVLRQYERQPWMVRPPFATLTVAATEVA